MRKYLILFVVTVFLAFATAYLLQTLNPFNIDEVNLLVQAEEIEVKEEFVEVIQELSDRGLILDYINSRNLAIVLATALLTVFSGFILLHLIADRVFFKKFYQRASLVTAIRRGVFLCLGILATVLYRLYAADWYLVILTLALLMIIELVVWKTLQPESEIGEVEESMEAQGGELVGVERGKVGSILKKVSDIPKQFSKQLLGTTRGWVARVRTQTKDKDEE